MLNAYERILSSEEIDQGAHRSMVGGFWEELGKLQFEFMVAEAGLKPGMRLLDLGCGALRGGVHFIRYLEEGNYYGVDSNASLIEAGWRMELTAAGVAGRLPRERLLRVSDFGAWRFGVRFDRALALSLWTHLPPHLLERSLWETARVLAPNGALYATIFLSPGKGPSFEPITFQPGGVTTHRDRDPFHYSWGDIERISDSLGLEAELIGEWGHPRAQQMVRIGVPARGRSSVRSRAQASGHSDSSGVTKPWQGLSRAVCVLGMHRSGTSALAGSLQAAGLPAGEVATKAAFNPRGNRENLEVRMLNDRVLEASGGSWDRPPNRLHWTGEQSRERDRVIAAFASRDPLWSFKDPRTLLTLPFWSEGAAELVFVGVYRDPAEVVASLLARGPIEGGGPEHQHAALRLWVELNRRLLELHRTDPFPLLRFGASGAPFGEQVAIAVGALNDRLGAPGLLSSSAARSFYEPELVHHQSSEAALDGADRVLLREATRIHEDLRERSLSGDPGVASC